MDYDESATVTGNSSIASSSLVLQNFQTSLANYASKQGPATTPRRSPRKQVSRRVDDITLKADQKSPQLKKRSAAGHDGSCNSKPSTESSPKKQKRGYAEPGTYTHLHELQDHLKEELDVMFCGINPGQKSAEVGHHFANPSNHFWHCLYESGFTPEKLQPAEDFTLPERFCLGLTNLVDRPTAEQSELSVVEQVSGVPSFLAKVARYRPRIVCFVGLGISKIVQTKLFHGKGGKSKHGLQPYKMTFPEITGESPSVIPVTTTRTSTWDQGTSAVGETLFYAVPSTSGRVVQFQRSDKVKIFGDLKNKLEEIKLAKLDTANFTVVVSPRAEAVA